MGPLAIERVDERIEARLLQEHIRRGGLDRFVLQRQVHPLVPAVLLRMARFDPLDLNPQPQPPDGQFAEAVERVRGRERHAIVGANRAGQPEVLERPFEDGEGELLLRGRERLARQEVATGEVGDRQRDSSSADPRA